MSELIFFTIPDKCPICGGETQIVVENNTEVLMCMNQECEGKMLNRIDHFLGKKGLDVKGISKATLSKLMDWGWVNDIPDLYKLQDHAAEWVKKPGFGAKSVGSILSSIEANRRPTLNKFIAAIGIPFIGNTHAKEITKHFPTYDLFREAVDCKFDFSTFEGFGIEKMRSILEFDYTIADEISGLMLGFSNEEVAASSSLKDMVICITGSVKHFKNRDEWAKFIADNGGKISSAVSKNTTVLINNDTESTSSKNLTAKKLGIPIMSEQEFLQKYI